MPLSQPLIRKTVLTRDLTPSLHKVMFSLFEQYYDHVTFEKFVEDLNEKTHVFMFHEKKSGRLIGFSSIFKKKLSNVASGVFLFSGDTVMHEAYWGTKALQKSFFWFILKSKLRSPFFPVYWMLMSKGIKTYMMMRKNFRFSYPNHNGITPSHFQHIVDNFYAMKYPRNYQAKKGLILFEEKVGSVKKNLETPGEDVMKHPDAAYFFKLNPLWENGDELACVAEIRFADFLVHVFKFFIPINRR